jgi:hypothetical protein
MTHVNATMIGCPACAGVLQVQLSHHGHQAFICTVGHAFTFGSLYQAKEEELERAQWSAIVLLEHLVMVLTMFQNSTQCPSLIPKDQIQLRLQQIERHIAHLRSMTEETRLPTMNAIP